MFYLRPTTVGKSRVEMDVSHDDDDDDGDAGDDDDDDS